jgi:hypothetical protein
MSEDSVDDETIEKARGVHECHNLLVQAQRTLWFNELFKQVSSIIHIRIRNTYLWIRSPETLKNVKSPCYRYSRMKSNSRLPSTKSRLTLSLIHLSTHSW